MNQSKKSQSTFSRTIALTLGVFAMVFLINAIVQAWTDAPAGTPPTCPSGYPGCDAPINVSSNAQTKAGPLTIAGDGGDAFILRNGGDLRFYNSSNTGSASLYCDVGAELSTPGNLKVGGTGTFNCINLGGVTECSWPAGDGGAGYWTQTGSRLYPNDIGWYVGIGTTDPGESKLRVVYSGLGYAIYGSNDLGTAAVRGDATNGAGLYGLSTNGYGLYAASTNGYGVFGSSTNGWSGYFVGKTYIGGNLGIGTTNPGAKLEVAGQVKITGGSPGAGKVLTSNATGLATWEALTGGGLPSGTSGQTLRHDGTTWVANSVIYNDGTNVAVGTTNPEGFRLNVSGGAEGMKVTGGTRAFYGLSNSPGSYGIYGESTGGGGVGVYGRSHANTGSVGVMGVSTPGIGVVGWSSGTGTKAGVYGQNFSDGIGVYGYSTNGTGVRGFSQNGWAGYFQGDVYIYGDVGVGTTDPTVKLDVDGYVKGRTGLCIGDDCRTEWPAGDGGAGYWTQTGSRLYPNDTNWAVSVGTTTPDSDADFHLKDVNDYANLVIEATGANYFPLIKMKNDYGNWQIWASDDDLAIRRNGVKTAILADGEIGVVGINTDNPKQQLSVNGDVGIWDAKALYFYPDQGINRKGYVGLARNKDLSLVSQTSGSWLRIGAENANISFWANGKAYLDDNPQVVIQPSGEVGIGVGDPTQKLDVDGYVKGRTGLCIGDDCRNAWPAGDGGDISGSGTATQIAFFTGTKAIGSDSNLYWDNTNKRLSIGATALDGILDIERSWSGANYVYVYNNVGGYNPSMVAGLFLGWNKSGGQGESIIGYSTQLGSTPRLDFTRWDGTTYSTDMTLKAGNVGIGTTDPTQKLDVDGYVKGRTGLCIGDDCRTEWPAGDGGAGYWTQTGSSLYPNNTGWNIGIGTNSPTEFLDVNGEIRVRNGIVSKYGLVSGTNDLGLYSEGAGNWMRVVTNGGDIRFFVDGSAANGYRGSSSAMRIDSGGSVYAENLKNCNTIDTDGSGKLICGTDETGTGGISCADCDSRFVNAVGNDAMTGNLTVGSGGAGFVYFGNRGYYFGDDSGGADLQTNAPNIYVYDGGWKRLCREGDGPPCTGIRTPSLGEAFSHVIPSRTGWMPPSPGVYVCGGEQITYDIYADEKWVPNASGFIVSDGTTSKVRLFNYNDRDPRTVYCRPVTF